MILKTKYLILRAWKSSDAEILYKYAKNPKIGLIAGWLPHTSIKYSLEIINTVFRKPETYAVVYEDEPIGCVNLLVYPDGNHYWGEGNCELGYWIAEEFWGNGFAVEASKKLIKRAFTELNLKQCFATFKKGNSQSKRVLEKLGFSYYGQVENIDFTGRYEETVMYLKNENI